MSDDGFLDHYLATAERVMEMAEDGSPAQLMQRVPSSPAWTAQQVVAHLAGLCEDCVTGNLTGYATEAWTQAQVDRFDANSIHQILARWRDALEDFAVLTESPLGQTPGRRGFGDAVSHEADLRPVLASGTRPPDAAVAVALKSAVSRWRVVLAQVDAPTLRIVEPVREWFVGAPASDGQPHASVEVDRYELFRALFGRRSVSQVANWAWSEDPERWVSANLSFPFSWADHDLFD